MRIVFIGPPGSGKGTQAERLTAHLGIPHVATGDALREAKAAGSPVGKMAAEYMDSGRLVPDPVIVQVVGERLGHSDCAQGCLFDGFPRTLGQAQALDAYLTANDQPLDVVIHLVVPEDTLVKRLTDRGRDDDNLQTVRRRFKEYKALTEPLLEYYKQQRRLQTVEGTGTRDEVFERILAVVEPLRETPARD